MSLAPKNRALLLAAVLSAAVAAILAVFVARSQPARVYYFMPGPLGRVVAPLRDSHYGFSISASQRFSISSRGSTGQQIYRSTGYLTRSIGLRGGEEAEWGKHNGITPALFFSHNLVNVFPRELYAKHPEFFPLADGKRLDPPPGYNYWNPDLGREDVAQYAAKVASRYFDAHPDAVSFSLGVNDGLVFGESPETLQLIEPLRWFRARPDYSRLVFTFMNRAAAELAKTHPDKYLGCLAYYWCENAPDFAVNPRVIPFLTADRAQSYDPAFVKEEFDLQNRWARALGAQCALNADTLKTEKLKLGQHQTGNTTIAGAAPRAPSGSDFSVSACQRVSISADSRVHPRIGLYDYLDDYGFLVPRVPIHAFAAHLRHAHEVGFTDYYGESARNWGLDGPMPWVIAQLLQDPEQDVDRLLDIYYQNYFGPAAAPMRAFFDRCEEQWMRQPGRSYWLKYYRNESQAKLFPPEVCRELRVLLNTAAALADGAADGRKAISDKRYAIGTKQNREQKVTKETKATKPFEQEEAERAERFADRNKGPATRDPGLADRPSAVRHAPSVRSPLPPVKPDWDLIRQRVSFVSAAFGVTERFVAFQYARDALARATLHRTVTASQLDTYLSARREFIRYSHEIAQRQPLAIYPIGYEDWLSDDPAFGAAYAVNAEKLKTEKLKSDARTATTGTDAQDVSVSASQRFSFSPAVSDGFAAAEAAKHLNPPDRLANGSLEGPVQRGRRIAGLQYALDLPAPWTSKVEPMEHALGIVCHEAARTGAQGLRISGAESTAAYQWLPAHPRKLYSVSAMVRGTVSPSAVVMLTVSWLDAHQHRIGDVQAMRLPEGRWPDWVQLRQGGPAPANAAWLGIGIRVEHQGGDDCVDVDDFSVRAAD